jgi:hypothetical protein
MGRKSAQIRNYRPGPLRRPRRRGEQSCVRWDIATAICSGTNPAYRFNPYPCTLDPNGTATALAVDCTLFTVGAPVGCTAV